MHVADRMRQGPFRTPRAAPTFFCGSQQPPPCRSWSLQINDALGAKGTVSQVRFIPKVPSASIQRPRRANHLRRDQDPHRSRRQPAFNAPAELNFTDLLKKVPTVIRHGLYVDETSATSTTHPAGRALPRVWGDNISYGTTSYLCQQPLILALI